MVRIITCTLAALSLCAGCQTGPLGGTKWNVIAVIDPDLEDRAAIELIQGMLVEFSEDGTLTTTTFRTDGTVEIDDRQRYQIDDDVISIKHPDYEFTAMFRFEEDHLRLHSETFVAILEPVRSISERAN